ncbi:hypothetical protein MASR2M70_12980 [Bacillota bacterium]
MGVAKKLTKVRISAASGHIGDVSGIFKLLSSRFMALALAMNVNHINVRNAGLI